MGKTATTRATAQILPDMDQAQRDFDRLTGKSINDTGSEPVEFRCVIRLDPAEEKTIGGIIIPDDRRDRSQMAATRATLLACGGNAFEDWKGLIPAPGDRVEVSKYAGVTREADPTDWVRIIQDKEILAVLT